MLVVGAGLAGLRTAIECALAGHRVSLVEKRREFDDPTRQLLWRPLAADLEALGVDAVLPGADGGMPRAVSACDLSVGLLKVRASGDVNGLGGALMRMWIACER